VPVAGYLESGILTLVIPLGLVVVVLLYWVIAARSNSRDF
jgi:hypothetical protein